MTISRAKAGFAMIGISIVFFLIADSIENLEKLNWALRQRRL